LPEHAVDDSVPRGLRLLDAHAIHHADDAHDPDLRRPDADALCAALVARAGHDARVAHAAH
jgi:hypothetical protein